MGPIVVKFGGSSLATAGQFEKVAAIIRENPARRYVVASAPGKRCSDDTKVTDLLYRCYDAACAGEDFLPTLTQIRQRFEDIIAQLHPALIIGVPVGFVNVVESKELVIANCRAPYIVARGRKGGSNVAAAICNAMLYQIRR